MGRIALKLLLSTITKSIQGINPNNQSIWLGHVRSLLILTIQKPSYEESDHFPRIFALLCCSKTPLCSSKTPLCSSKKNMYEKPMLIPMKYLVLRCKKNDYMKISLPEKQMSKSFFCRVSIFPQGPFFNEITKKYLVVWEFSRRGLFLRKKRFL